MVAKQQSLMLGMNMFASSFSTVITQPKTFPICFAHYLRDYEKFISLLSPCPKLGAESTIFNKFYKFSELKWNRNNHTVPIYFRYCRFYPMTILSNLRIILMHCQIIISKVEFTIIKEQSLKKLNSNGISTFLSITLRSKSRKIQRLPP